MTRKDIARKIRWSLGLVSFVATLAAQVAWAGIEPTPFRTGLFGVVAGQAVRISVVNTGDTAGTINPCVRIWSAAGVLLAETDAGPLAGGAATFVEFTPVPDDGEPSGTPSRGLALLRVEVVPIPDDGQPVPEDGLPAAGFRLLRSIVPTLEVFDLATGQTRYTTPFAAVAGIEPEPFAPIAGIDPTPFAPVAGVDPQPFKTGLLGVTAGQAIRVSVLNAGDVGGIINPCVRVFDAAGLRLLEADAGPLGGGVGTSVEFSPVPDDGEPSGTPSRGRALVRVEVQPVPDDGVPVPEDGLPDARLRLLGRAIPTLEVFDTATDQTLYTLPFVKVGFNPQPEP